MGKITISNFSEQPMLVHIIGQYASGVLVASGVLASAQTSGFLVSGYNGYRVDFRTANRGAITASNVAPESVVQIEINGQSSGSE